uniref:Uncharacterized protein n=1 Tax=Rhizophora mucronata TaxID=61149 RepID=A0A2P2NV70_RHIMU
MSLWFPKCPQEVRLYSQDVSY